MSSSGEQILIVEILKDIVIGEEGKTIVLDCKLSNCTTSGKWYKDGTLLVSCDKTKITNKRLWQMLEITSVNKDDEGIYCFAVETTKYVYTKCILFVKPTVYDNITYNFSEHIAEPVRVCFHLRNDSFDEGEFFSLKAEFSASIEKCTWYKNNRVVPAMYPRIIRDEQGYSTCRLYVNKPVRANAGLYSIIAKTYDGHYLCSYADILIGCNFTNDLYNNEFIPHSCLESKKRIQVFDHDNVRMMCKMEYDSYSIIEWIKSGYEVKLSDRIKCETYFNRYIALKICDVTVADSGIYFLLVRDSLSRAKAIYYTQLNVEKFSQQLPECSVRKSLMPTVVGVGNGVTFEVSFNIPEPKYNYVVWDVGHYSIEKSSSKFKVLCNEDKFILHIPVVTPEMNGEICCQLRQHIPPQKSVLLCTTTSYLAVVPTQFMEDVKKNNLIVKQKNIYSDLSFTLLLPRANSNIRSETSPLSNDTLLHFQFCRISGGNLFFKAVNKENRSEKTSVSVENKAVSDPNTLLPTHCDWRISWVRPNKNDWYAFDVCQANGEYTEIGVSNSSTLDIREPPEDKLLNFRVRMLRPKKKRTITKLCYVSKELHMKDSARPKEILLFKEYKKTYSNGIRIGNGRFGYVNTVSSRDGEVLISKISKASRKTELSKWSQPIMEFEILKTLSHPNTVSMRDGYFKKGKTGYIITMEYLWGGEFIEQSIDRETLAEVDVIVYVKQILLALEYIHGNKIAHLDLKPANIIFINRNSRTIKLIDFGMARVLKKAITLPNIDGSRDFMPPEIIHGELIGTYCDMWNLGVLTYWLLTGRMPFVGLSWKEKKKNISEGLYSYDDTQFRLISDSAKEFVSFLIRRCPNERMSAVVALKNRWITHGPSEGRPMKIPISEGGGLKLVPIPPPFVQEKWKLLIDVILAVLRFRAKLRSNPYAGRRRFSVRLLVRRMNVKISPST